MGAHLIYYKGKVKMMRPILTAAEYRNLRDGGRQKSLVFSIRKGNEGLKSSLVQMNYSCLPNDDGTLSQSKRMSNCVGMDIDFKAPPELSADEAKAWMAERMKEVPELVLSKKDELGLLMLERSASKGYHLVFRRRPELSQEENLTWASELLGVAFDEKAKDITRVFFTTTASAEDLLFLDDALFEIKEVRDAGIPESRSLGIPESRNAGITEVRNAGITESRNPDISQGSGAFKGIPYADIIAEYWRRTGGEPQEGERNVKLHKLAVNLRAICDNRKEVLLQVMPRYGLTEAEVKSVVDSACKEPPKGITKVMQQTLDALEMGMEQEQMGEEPSDSSVFLIPTQLRKALPIGLKESLVGVPATMHIPVLCSVLPLAAAYADQVTVEYCDGNTHRLGLMSIIRGEQASNKSVCKNAVDIWKRQLAEEDALARKREDEWKERRKSRKANEKAPDDPKVLIRMVPVTVSCSTLLKRLKNACGHTLYSFGEEIDTLRKTNGAGSWSSKYDIYRLSFDYGEWGQDYNSDQAESGDVNVAYNWTMLGTNGAMRKCFKSDNIENGLSSRMLVAEMPDGRFQKMPKFGKRSAEDIDNIQQAVTRLRSVSGEVDVPRLRKAIDAWVEEKRVEAEKDIDHVKDVYRRRAAVIGFRCGVVFHLLSGKDKESKACLDFARMMAEYCLNQQIKVFGEVLRNEYVNAHDECRRHSANHSVFDQLPPTFTMDDLTALKGSSLPRNTIIKIISRWSHDGWVTKVDQKHWTKTKGQVISV